MPADASSLELAALICAVPRPVLFFDTAGILDILRAPFRDGLPVDIVASTAELVEDLRVNPKRLWVVSTANVMLELNSNREAVRLELGGQISAVTKSVSRLAQVARLVVPEKRIHELDWLDAMVEQRIVRVMDQFVDSIDLFRGTSACVERARNRLWAGRPPASRSKQEYKDCEIFEEFLELAGELRRRGFDQPIVFVSPNSTDYGKAPRGHDAIAADLGSHGCDYVANASWARARISDFRRSGNS